MLKGVDDTTSAAEAYIREIDGEMVSLLEGT